ncbi:MAG: hypothetical protein HDR88_17310 [Bacteroides sp.]|nr:hypothetical protein [Bacteroides sp.]
MVTLKRILLKIAKVFLYLLCSLALFIGVYMVLNLLFGGPGKICDIYNSLTRFEWEAVFVLDSVSYTGQEASIFLGIVSIFVTLLTMFQQHINRLQDRVLAFPKMIMHECQFVIDPDSVMVETSFFCTDPADLLIRIKFKEAFSTYYQPLIYRVWIVQRPYGKYTYGERERIEIVKGFLHLSGEDYYLAIAAEESKLINDFCRIHHKYDYTIEIVFDIQWVNMLTPFGLRNMSSLYLRNVCRLSNQEKKRENEENEKNGQTGNNKRKSEYTYSVDNIEVKGAPIWVRPKGNEKNG